MKNCPLIFYFFYNSLSTQRRTGQLRPTSGPSFGKRSKNGGNERHKRKPPRGMHINHDDIVALATDSEQANRNDQLLSGMDREIVSLWSQVRKF